MSPRKIVVESVRVEQDDDKRLMALFDKWEQESLDNLEKAARELIGLVTAFFTVIFGILALGGKEAAPALALPLPLIVAGLSLALLLITLLAALDVVLPGAYQVREESLSDRKAAYAQMLARKSRGLRGAVYCFGGAMALFAALIGWLLFFRATGG